MTVEELRRLTLLQAVLSRPKMYTVNGTLPELLAFFNGCLQPSPNETRNDGSVRSFFDWLIQLLEFDSQLFIPNKIYESTFNHFGSEADAMVGIKKTFLDPEDLTEMN